VVKQRYVGPKGGEQLTQVLNLTLAEEEALNRMLGEGTGVQNFQANALRQLTCFLHIVRVDMLT